MYRCKNIYKYTYTVYMYMIKCSITHIVLHIYPLLLYIYI